MDENILKTWSELILDRINSLEENIKNIQVDLKTHTLSVYNEINKSKDDIKDVCIMLQELKRINDRIDNFKEDIKEYKSLKDILNDAISTIKQDIVSLKVKSRIWGGLSGAASGLLSAISVALIYIISKK